MMITPKNRSEFERNIHLLVDRINNRNYNIPSIKMIHSFMNVKNLPNKRLNLLTVDESVRLQANSIANFEWMDLSREENEEE